MLTFHAFVHSSNFIPWVAAHVVVLLKQQLAPATPGNAFRCKKTCREVFPGTQMANKKGCISDKYPPGCGHQPHCGACDRNCTCCHLCILQTQSLEGKLTMYKSFPVSNKFLAVWKDMLACQVLFKSTNRRKLGKKSAATQGSHVNLPPCSAPLVLLPWQSFTQDGDRFSPITQETKCAFRGQGSSKYIKVLPSVQKARKNYLSAEEKFFHVQSQHPLNVANRHLKIMYPQFLMSRQEFDQIFTFMQFK